MSQTCNMYKLCSLPADGRLPVDVEHLTFGHGSQSRTISKVKYTNRPHSLGEEQDSKPGNSLTVIGIFRIKACDPWARLQSGK